MHVRALNKNVLYSKLIGERRIEGSGGETWEKEATWKTKK